MSADDPLSGLARTRITDDGEDLLAAVAADEATPAAETAAAGAQETPPTEETASPPNDAEDAATTTAPDEASAAATEEATEATEEETGEAAAGAATKKPTTTSADSSNPEVPAMGTPPEETPKQTEPENLEQKTPPPSATTPTPIMVPWREAWRSASQRLGTKLSICVAKKAEAVGNALNRHVVYKVTTTVLSAKENDSKEAQYVVARRFSEFATLRDALAKRYAGLLIPPIPPKVVMGNVSLKNLEDAPLVKSRQRVLALFAEGLSEIPWLADDVVLRAFCGENGKDDDQWQKKVAAVADEDDAPVALDEDNIESTKNGHRGRALWFAALVRAPAPPEPPTVDKLLGEAVARLDALHQATDAAGKAASKAAEACARKADALQTLAEGIAPWRGETARWAAASAALADKAAGAGSSSGAAAADASSQSPPPTCEKSAAAATAALDAWTQRSRDEAVVVESRFQSGLQWQQLQIQAMRELIAKRAALLDDLGRHARYLGNLRARKASGKTSAGGFSSSSPFGGGSGMSRGDDRSSSSGGNAAGAPPQSKTRTFLSGLRSNLSSVGGSSSSSPQGQGASENAAAANADDSIDDLIDQAVKHQAHKERAIELHARALCYSELDRFKDDYNAAATTWAKHFFHDHADLALGAAAKWDDALAAIGLSR